LELSKVLLVELGSIVEPILLPLLQLVLLRHLAYFVDEDLSELDLAKILVVLLEHLQEEVDVLLLWEFKRLLYYRLNCVVPILMQHYLLEQAALRRLLLLVAGQPLEQLVEDQCLAVAVRVHYQGFYNRGGELGVAEFDDVLANDEGDCEVDVLVLTFYDFANYVVREFIVDELLHIVKNLFLDSILLLYAARPKAILHDAAALLVLGQLQSVGCHRLVDRLLLFFSLK